MEAGRHPGCRSVRRSRRYQAVPTAMDERLERGNRVIRECACRRMELPHPGALVVAPSARPAAVRGRMEAMCEGGPRCCWRLGHRRSRGARSGRPWRCRLVGDERGRTNREMARGRSAHPFRGARRGATAGPHADRRHRPLLGAVRAWCRRRRGWMLGVARQGSRQEVRTTPVAGRTATQLPGGSQPFGPEIHLRNRAAGRRQLLPQWRRPPCIGCRGGRGLRRGPRVANGRGVSGPGLIRGGLGPNFAAAQR